MKFSFVVTMDAPDVAEGEASAEQVETARLLVQKLVSREVSPAGIHVTTTVQRGLPLHPFNPHPFPTP